MAGLGLGQVAAGSRASTGPEPTRDAPTPALGTFDPSVSADGRYVVFTGAPAVNDGRDTTVWLTDRSDGSLTELTRTLPGVRPGNSVKPVISADGCVVAVVTEMAYDLFRDDDGPGRWDVYRIVLPQCGGAPDEWELVSSTSAAGRESSATDAVDPSGTPAISGTGSVVAYVTSFDAANPDLDAVIVADLTVPMGEPGRTRPVAGTPAAPPNTTFRYRGLREPSLSDDGELVAFTSDAESDSPDRTWSSGQVPGGFATSQVFVWDRTNTDPATAVTRVSAGAVPADGGASSPAVSADGRYVAFQSSSTNLVTDATLAPCGDTCSTQVYRYDRTDASMVLVSRRAPVGDQPGDPADTGAWAPSITSDGSEVLFVTRATNLFPVRPSAGGTVGDGELVVAEMGQGTLRRVSVLPDGVTPAPASNGHARLSTLGRAVVFDTLAPDAFGVTGTGRQVAVLDQRPSLSLSDLDVGSGGIGFPGPEWFVSVINDGPSTFSPASVKSSNPEFAVTGGTCAQGILVPPGGTCTVNITLTPAGLGPRGGTLTVSEAGFEPSTVTAQLRGAGGGAVLAPAPAGADLPPLVIGELGQPVDFSVFNVGFRPTSVTDYFLQGANPTDFVVTASDCRNRVLAIGESCTVSVAFSPTGAGRRTATLVAVNVDGEYTTMLLSGVGSYRPAMVLSTDTLLMGSRLDVLGSGFAPNSTVTLLWADGAGRRTVATTDASGVFVASILIGAAERSGLRTLVAQGSFDTTASASVTLIRNLRSTGPGSAAWPGR
jgi:Tol biopolymer transport system component